MKRFFVFLAVIGVIFSVQAESKNTIQFMLRNSVTKSDYTFPQTWFFLTHQKDDNLVGFNGYAYALEGWGECYGGLSIYPISQPNLLLTFALYGGVETAPGYWRIAFDGMFIKDNFSFYGLYEYGASKEDGDYFYACAGYKITNWLKPEVKGSKFGPTWRVSGGAQFFIPDTPVSFEPIANWNFDSEEPEADISIYLDF